MMQVAMIPAVDVLRKEHHDESVVEQGQQRYKNEDDVLFQEEEQEREQDKFDENTSPLHPEAAAAEIAVSSTHESHEMKRHAVEDNASVQVAIRIRPLLTNEDPHESLQLFASSLSSSSSSSNVMGDTNSHFMKSKTMSESTMATAPESSTSYSDVFHQNYQMLQVGEGDTAPAFTFDHVFPSTAGQEQVYDTCVTPLVESCLEGYNATVLAYGQTGSGKTHTILGSLEEKIDDHVTPYDDDDNDHGGEYMENDHDGEEGVIPRALKDIFHGLQDLQSNAIIRQQQEDKSDPSSTSAVAATCPNPSGTKPFEYCIKIQFVELYGEEIRDLLADLPQDDGDGTISHDGRPKLRKVKTSGDLFATPRTKITIRDGKIGEGAELMGVERFEVKSAREALHYLRMGLARRVVGKTAMNVHSSRSHAIFTAVVHQTVRRYLAVGGGGGAGSGGQSNTKLVGEKLQVEMKTSKMHFVDLCGSERVKRAQTTGKRLKEGIDINKGLLALGNVISALGKSGPRAHVPYRDSKLTRILKGSLGGNHKTLMIACVSPSLSNISETTNTLRYANRAKNIKNNAKINVDPQYQVVHELRDQVAALAAELLRMRSNQSRKEEDDFPFSIDFLNELVRGGDGSVWRQKGLKRSASMNIHTLVRPSTSPAVSVVTPERTIGREGFGHLQDYRKMEIDSTTEGGAIHDDDAEWDASSAEDPELAKNIESYDFALATLRQSVHQKMARQNQKSNQPPETIIASLEKAQDHELQHDKLNADDDKDAKDHVTTNISPPPSPPPSPPSALKKVRNIDELYDYLNNNTYVDENGKIVDDEGTVVSEVVQSHVLKLEEAIFQNEKILREMETSHEIFEMMKADNIEKLAEIETELHLYRKERESLSSVHSLLDEESHHSKGLEKALAVKDEKIAELIEEREEVLMLKERSNDNLKSMNDLKKSIAVMKKQHSNLSQIKSRPLSHDKMSIISFEADGNGDNLHSSKQNAIRTAYTNPSSSDRIPGIDSTDDFLTPTSEKLKNEISPDDDYFRTPRSRFSTWGTDDTPSVSDIDIRLRDANRNAYENSSNAYSHRASLGKIPRFLETPLDSTNHSSISLLETPVVGSDHGVEVTRTPRFSNRRRSVTLDTHYELSSSSNIVGSGTKDFSQSFPSKRARKPRGARPASATLSEMEPLSYSKMLIKRDDLTTSTHSVPRSVFDVVDESISRGQQRTESVKRPDDVDYDSGGEDHNWCGAGFFLDTLRDMFGFKNPVLRKWEI